MAGWSCAILSAQSCIKHTHRYVGGYIANPVRIIRPRHTIQLDPNRQLQVLDAAGTTGLDPGVLNTWGGDAHVKY